MCVHEKQYTCVCLHLRFVTIPLCKTLDFASEFANSLNNLARARLVHAPSIKYSRSYHTIDSAHTSILTNWQGKEYNFSMPKMQNSKFWPHSLTINKPIFWGVWNRGIGAVTNWKFFLWKIIHIYIGVVFHQRFFQKGVTKKIFFFRDHFY